MRWLNLRYGPDFDAVIQLAAERDPCLVSPATSLSFPNGFSLPK